MSLRRLALRFTPMRKGRRSVVTVSQRSQQNHDAARESQSTERLSYVGDVAPPTRTPIHAPAKRTPRVSDGKPALKEVPKPQRRLPCGFELAAPCGAFGTPNMRGILSVGAGAPGRGSKAPKKSRIESSILRLPRVVWGFDVVPRT